MSRTVEFAFLPGARQWHLEKPPRAAAMLSEKRSSATRSKFVDVP
jgi:hypothetical protein